MDLSIVTSMYHSASHLEEFYDRIRNAALRITDDFEIIFVNDGSPDNSLEIAVSLHEADPKVKIVDLSRNFGHHRAILIGLAHAKGDLVLLIDCDLEVPPEVLLPLHEELIRSGADTTYGVQEGRKGGLFERVSGKLFYQLFNKLSFYPVPPSPAGVRLMKRPFLESLLRHRERTVFLAGLCAITGYRQVPVVVEKTHKGHSTYTLARKIDLFVTAISSFSEKPLIFIFYLGLFISFLSGGAACYLIVRRVLFQEYLIGWPSLIVSIWLLGGLSIFCLGIIGIYLAKIFVETKNRPYAIVRTFYERSEHVGEERDTGIESRIDQVRVTTHEK
ncbi:MAG: glycosyltransferase family 2 protein [Deltaproteobacteria bacterium]